MIKALFATTALGIAAMCAMTDTPAYHVGALKMPERQIATQPAITEYAAKEIDCMALNIYYEARGESYDEQVAVASVTVNRILSNKWPDSACEVVYQPYQFSWTMDDGLRKPLEQAAYLQAMEIALDMWHGRIEDNTGGADHYYAHGKIKPPRWADETKITAVMSGHTYFKL